MGEVSRRGACEEDGLSLDVGGNVVWDGGIELHIEEMLAVSQKGDVLGEGLEWLKVRKKGK